MAVSIEHQDGTIDVGPTPESVVEVIAAGQWDEHMATQMIHALSGRACRLGRHAIDAALPLHELFEQLAAAGLCRILEWALEPEGAAAPRPATSRRLSMRARREREADELG